MVRWSRSSRYARGRASAPAREVLVDCFFWSNVRFILAVSALASALGCAASLALAWAATSIG